MKVTLLGTGTSQGVPVIGCDCDVCLSENPKDKRLRSSILVEKQGVTFSVDAGPDFRQQMLIANVKKLDAVVFTHNHKDHTAGLDDVRAFNFLSKKPMELFLNDEVDKTLTREYEYIFANSKYPGVPKVNMNLIDDEANSIDVCGVKVDIVRLMHYKLPVLGFKIDNFAYCTDVNYISPYEKGKLKNLDVLVISALRKEPHISHFNLEQVLALVEQVKPKKTYLTHISHLLGKHSEIEAELPENVHMGYDGLEILLSA